MQNQSNSRSSGGNASTTNQRQGQSRLVKLPKSKGIFSNVGRSSEDGQIDSEEKAGSSSDNEQVVNAETVDSPEKYMDADLESAADRRNFHQRQKICRNLF